jgi:dihydroorotate dehydrogenase electron transfer subunit
MSICRVDEEEVDIAVWLGGAGSRWLLERAPGAQLDCIGPQGHGFRIDHRTSHLLMVGSGFGVAPLVALADKAVALGSSVALAVDAGSAEDVFPTRLLPTALEYIVATRDGSVGSRGDVMDALEPWIQWADTVCVSADGALTHRVADRLRTELPRKRAQAGIAPQMACATGLCLGCMVPTSRGLRRACVDGPVFDLGQISWGDLSW